MRRPRRADEGTTLVELIVVMVLLGILGTVIAGQLITATKASAVADGVSDSAQRAQRAMVRLAREVRSARAVDAGSDATRIIVWVDVDADSTRDAGETVTYAFTGSGDARTLTRTTSAIPAVTTTVATGLTAASAFAYDVAAPATRVVRIDLGSSSAAAPTPVTLHESVRLRNVA